MELPTTLESCHELIRELLVQNTALRQSGEAFGRLAERLSAALAEERRRPATPVGPKPSRRSEPGKMRWSALRGDDSGSRWCPTPSSGPTWAEPLRPIRLRSARPAGAARRDLPSKGVL